MDIVFPNKTLPSVPIKKSGKIKEVIDAYHEKQIPMKQLLTDYLAIQSKATFGAYNSWEYHYKGIKGQEVERGVSVLETAFIFYAMKLNKSKPTDVINAAFYTNIKRNDSVFEIGYLLPLLAENIDENDNILVVNPSPNMISNIEDLNRNGNNTYAVTDETVARLYKIQFPDSEFITFDSIRNAKDIDTVLITNRDQKAVMMKTFLSSLDGCNDTAKVIALVPNVWFDNEELGVKRVLDETGFRINQALIVDPKATNSSPRKKLLAVLEKGKVDSIIQVNQSSYNKKTREFTVNEKAITVDANEYLESGKTIYACCKEVDSAHKDKQDSKYKKAIEYPFSDEISLFYRLNTERKNRCIGRIFYKEIRDIGLKKWGKQLSPEVEKRFKSEAEIDIASTMERVIFEDALYPIIRSDVERKCVGNRSLTLKTIWFCCWSSIKEMRQYDHEFALEFFNSQKAANVIPQMGSAPTILERIAEITGVDLEDISINKIECINTVLKMALKLKLIPFNPLESYVEVYSKKASDRQQEARNALVKKHFSRREEFRIFLGIIGDREQKDWLCIRKSILLASAIRLFTGMSIREVAALKWRDFRSIDGSVDYQFLITKFVDREGELMSHAEKQNWNRFRLVPSVSVLTSLLLSRRKYLLDQGIDDDYLSECPIVLGEERIQDMKKRKRVGHCKPQLISKTCNELINLAHIPVNEIVLPDERNDLVTDLNRYLGDIFQSNFRDKANHEAYMTVGEINYVIGVNAPDTFSRHYCDYTNSFVQRGIIQKLRRWSYEYEQIVLDIDNAKPSYGESNGSVSLNVGPYDRGVASVSIAINNDSDSDVQVNIHSAHGVTTNSSEYEDEDGEDSN